MSWTTTAALPGTSLAVTNEEREARKDGIETEQIWEELRRASKQRPAAQQQQGGCTSFLCRLLLCLTPDIVEDAAAQATKTTLKATIDTLHILQAVAGMDPRNLGSALSDVFWASEPDWEACKFDKEKSSSPGYLTSKEMIYCCRLSLVSYLSSVGYDDFFPLHRERELLDRVFAQDGSNEVHQIFLVNYVSSLFDQTRDSPTFGQAKPLQTNLEPMSLELVREFNVKFNQGFVAKSKLLSERGGDIVIAFQGTVDKEDVATSMRGTSTPFEPLFDEMNAGAYAWFQGRGCACCVGETPEQLELRAKQVTDFGRVHIGFYDAFLCIKPLIEEILLDLLTPEVTQRVVRIVVTGHSLGGALASLCTAWLVQWFRFKFPGGLPPTFRVLSVTFGQPKVGDAKFSLAMQTDQWTNRNNAEEAKFKTYRVFAALDPVVTVPPLAMGYHHCYSMCALNAGGLYFLPPGFAKNSDTTTKGMKNAIDHGMSILQFHDLFCYLSSVMHFADMTRDNDQDMDAVFGVVDYQADVIKEGFLERF